MKFYCSTDSLAEMVSVVQKAISTRSTLPILDGILIVTEDRGIRLTGYDLETGIEAFIQADIVSPGQIVLSSRLFGDIVRKLSEEQVKIESDDNLNVTIESGASVFSIKGLSADSYPRIPIVSDEDKLTMSQSLLKDMIRQTIFAVSTDESRPVLNGCLVSCDGFIVEVVAIDGFRMAIRKRLIGDDLPKMKYLIPGKAMNEVGKILSGKNEDIVIYSSRNHIMFDIGDIRLVSRLIQGEYMNYKAVMPTSSATTLTIATKDLLSAMERAALIIISDEKRCPVNFYMETEDTMIIRADSTMGNMREEIPVSIVGEMIDIDFNPRFLIDALRVIEKDEITLRCNGNIGPCVICPVEGDDFHYLVLPLRK